MKDEGKFDTYRVFLRESKHLSETKEHLEKGMNVAKTIHGYTLQDYLTKCEDTKSILSAPTKAIHRSTPIATQTDITCIDHDEPGFKMEPCTEHEQKNLNIDAGLCDARNVSGSALQDKNDQPDTRADSASFQRAIKRERLDSEGILNEETSKTCADFEAPTPLSTNKTKFNRSVSLFSFFTSLLKL